GHEAAPWPVGPHAQGYGHDPVLLRRPVTLIDQARVRRLGGPDPLLGLRGAAAVQRDRDAGEASSRELLVERLPHGQVEAAPSPRGPEDEEDLAAAVVAEPMHTAV